MLRETFEMDETLSRPTIRVTPNVYRSYRESIASNAPETFALLGGSLDDPFRITDFFFLPPKRDERGGFVASSAFVYPDHEQVNYIIDNVLVKNGRYMLGFWHSHPGSFDRPSDGDLDFCSRIIANDDSIGRRWNYFLAPITTFHRGEDLIRAWILPKGHSRFLSADFSVEETDCESAAFDSKQKLRAMASRLAHELKRHHRSLDEIQKYRIACSIASACAVVRNAADSARPHIDKKV
jgi:proteasome lid subunit RPN8/RPN11